MRLASAPPAMAWVLRIMQCTLAGVGTLDAGTEFFVALRSEIKKKTCRLCFPAPWKPVWPPAACQCARAAGSIAVFQEASQAHAHASHTVRARAPLVRVRKCDSKLRLDARRSCHSRPIRGKAKCR